MLTAVVVYGEANPHYIEYNDYRFHGYLAFLFQSLKTIRSATVDRVVPSSPQYSSTNLF